MAEAERVRQTPEPAAAAEDDSRSRLRQALQGKEARQRRRLARRTKLLHLSSCAAIGLFVGLMFAAAYWADFGPEAKPDGFTPLKGFERSVYDLLFRLRGNLPREAVCDDIVFLDIDDETLNTLGQFPLPRRYYAEALKRLKKARTVGFDIFFPDPSPILLSLDRRDEIMQRLETLARQHQGAARATDMLKNYFISDDRLLGKTATEHGRASFSFFSSHLLLSLSKLSAELGRLFAIRDRVFQRLENEEATGGGFLVGDETALEKVRALLPLGENFSESDRAFIENSLRRRLFAPYLKRFSSALEKDEALRQAASETTLIGSSEKKLDAAYALIATRLKISKQLAEAVFKRWKHNDIVEAVWEAYTEAGAPRDFVGFVDRLVGSNAGYEQLIGRFKTREEALSRKYFQRRMLQENLFDFKDFNHTYDLSPPVLTIAHGSRHLAFVQIKPDPDGVVRRFPTAAVYCSPEDFEAGKAGHLFFSLGMCLLLDAVDSKEKWVRTEKRGEQRFVIVPYGKPAASSGKRPELRIPVDAHGRLFINWAGRFEDRRLFKHYPLSALIERDDVTGKYTPAADKVARELEDKIVIVGLTAVGTHDYNPNPFSPRQPLVSAHANFLNTVLTGRFIEFPPPWPNAALIVGGALLLSLLAGGVKHWVSLSAWLVFGGGWFGIVYYAFARYDLTANVLYVEGALLFTLLGVIFYRFLTEERQKRQTRGVMRYYLSPDVVEELLQDPEGVRLGGEKRELTALFSDIEGFSRISERIGDPERLVGIINRYMDEICAPLLARRGTIDKFIGDAVVAFWGAPIRTTDHAEQACLAALEAKRAEEPLRKRLLAEGFPEIRTRFGVNTGEMLVGNMGSSQKFNYTVMGDAVNLASRLEGANKNYGTYLMIGEGTYVAAKHAIEARELDLIAVKGKTEPTRVYELAARKGELTAEQEKGFAVFTEALCLYRARKFAEAEARFQEVFEHLPEDPPAKTYMERCRLLTSDPPPDDWDGVWRLTSK